MTPMQVHDSETSSVTLIFVDVDGVLNVGLSDDGGPLSFDEANLSIARKSRKGTGNSQIADKLLGTIRMQHSSDDRRSTFADFVCRDDLNVCDIFVHRLVKILSAAGDKRRVILSSSWRNSDNALRVKKLQNIIGNYLGDKFEFDDTLPREVERGGEDRLRLIGEYMATYGKNTPSAINMQALVLDDFSYQPIRNFTCGGTAVDSLESAEAYLAACPPAAISATVRIIHTYNNLLLPCGEVVDTGAGISKQHLTEALAFLGASENYVGVPPNVAVDMPIVQKSNDESEHRPLANIEDDVATMIFLDIDGVLNVSLRIPRDECISLTGANLSVARKLFERRATGANADILLSLMSMRACDGDSSTFADLLSRNDLDVCDLFIHRFVEILRAAGRMRRVILTSSSRRAGDSAKVQQLERIVSSYLREKFTFDDWIGDAYKSNGHDRLGLIRGYVANHCSKQLNHEKIKVLVLDGSDCLPIERFESGDTMVDLAEAAESYVEACSTMFAVLNVRIIHTCENAMFPWDLDVNIGTGLTLSHLCQALEFLGTKFTQSDRQRSQQMVNIFAC